MKNRPSTLFVIPQWWGDDKTGIQVIVNLGEERKKLSQGTVIGYLER